MRRPLDARWTLLLWAALGACGGEPTTDEEAAAPARAPVYRRTVSEGRVEEVGALAVGDRLLGLDADETASGERVTVRASLAQDAGRPVRAEVEASVVSVSRVDPAEAAARYQRDAARFDSAALAARLARVRGAADPAAAAARAPAVRRARVDAALTRALAGAATGRVQALVVLRHAASVSPWLESEKLRALGQLEAREAALFRRDLTDQLADEVARAQAPIAAQIAEAGGRVVERFWVESALWIEAPAALLASLAERDDVASIEAVRRVSGEALDGRDVVEGTQMDAYVDHAFDGEAPNPTRHDFGDITLAIIDTDFESAHPVFKDTAGTSRIKALWDCSASPCVSVASMTPVSTTWPHGNMVAGIAVGDLADGQDPNVTTTAARRARSGHAPEAGVVFIALGSSEAYQPSVLRALQLAATLGVDGVNLSQRVDGVECEGVSSTSGAVNSIGRLHGVFVTKSAGNEGHYCRSDTGALCTQPGVGMCTVRCTDVCSVTGPGAAAYAITVGASVANDSDPASTAADVKAAKVADQTSRGGGPYLGGTRSLIATSAPGGRQYVAASLANGTYDSYFNCCATSFAAPVIAGFLADYRHHLLASGVASSIANSLGRTIAALLLMGDAKSELGGALTAGFDDVRGNGRFRARKFDDAGMDAPWGFTTGVVSVSDGEHVSLPISVPAGADRLVVTMWWPEPNTEDGGAEGADISMTLTPPATHAPVLIYGDWSYDTKKRLVIGSKAAGSWTLGFVGYSVPEGRWDTRYSGTGGLLRLRYDVRSVYYAYYFEDAARDDADGPSADVQ